MTTSILESRAPSSLRTLRVALDTAEKQVAHLDGSNVEGFLVLLDQIEQLFAEFGQEKGAVSSEQGRWDGLLHRISSTPGLLVGAAAHAGGLAKLHSRHPSAEGFWWHLDAEVARRRAQTFKRAGITVGAVLVAAALVFFAFSYFTPSGATAELLTTTSAVEQMVRDQKLPQALADVEKARQTMPDEPELLVWEAVLAEQLGDAARAKTSLAQAQQKYVDSPAAFWTLVGNDRLQVGNLDGAEQAGQQALALAPQDARVTFLLGSVAEARGDTLQAADFFSRTITLAGDSNPQLAVTAKVRLGYLSQSVGPLPGAAPSDSLTPVSTPQTQ